MPQLNLILTRTSICLGQEELGRGGEGRVFPIEGQKDRVAKIYSSPLDYRKAWKLLVMALAARPSLLNIAAWPLDVLIDSKGTPRGFIMPRVDAHWYVHELYTPKSRSEAFPAADFRFLVRVAAKIARAFAVVHEQGVVVGDVNHGNVLVRRDGTVKLIDCDSFQIGHRPNVYTCDVGVPPFTAPELQGLAFRGLERTANHDRFGLAVLLFHLLYMGRHPFAGRHSASGDMPPEKAIGEYRFAYGPDGAANGMARPPRTVPLETMGSAIAQLFIRAFGRAGSNGARPDAKTWVEALEKLKISLQVCSLASSHYYPRDLSACPWCMVEIQTGTRLFGQRIVAGRAIRAIDLARLRSEISAVSDPGADPALPSERPWHPPPGIEVPSRRLKIFRKIFSISIGLVFAGFAAYIVPTKDGGIAIAALAFCSLAGVIWPWVSPKKKSAANGAYQAAEAEWEGALARWEREAARNAFNKKRKSLEDAHAEISELMRRRQRHERNFRFNPSDPGYRRDVDAMDRELEARIQKLLSTLRQGRDQLRQLSQEINAARERLMPTLEETWNALKITEARRNALR